MGALLSASQLRSHADVIQQVFDEGRRLLKIINPDAYPDALAPPP